MHITQLNIENVKRLTAVSIKPDGNMIVIGGDNAQGKTSALDSIYMAIAGNKAVGDKPLHEGSKKGKIEVNLGTDAEPKLIEIKRTFTPSGGGTLVVKDKDGNKFSSPQSMLDAIVGKLSFDPLSFTLMENAKQLATLKDLVGLDTSTIDAKRADLYNERTLVNRDVKNAAGAVESMPIYEVDETISITGIIAQMDKAREVNASNQQARSKFESKKADILQQQAELQELTDEIIRIEKQRDSLSDQLAKNKAEGNELFKANKTLQDIDIAPLQAQLDAAEETTAKIQANKHRASEEVKMAVKQKESNDLTAQIEKLDEDKQTMLSEAKFPIKGLSFDETGILYKGIPFSQASSAEKLTVSVAMGIALNPDLKVLLIRDGSLLDSKSRAKIAAMADKHDCQMWVEVVSKGDDCQVIIDDGKVLGASVENDTGENWED